MPVRGGNKFQAQLQKMAGAVTSAERVRVGFMESARYPDGKPVAMIAAIQEFGAPRAGIPPRPFMRNMIAAKSPEWGPATGALLIANGYDAQKTLRMVGEAIAGQLRQSIVDTNEPPLADSTIRRKGFAKPLVDTGHMQNSIDYEVT